MLQGLGTFAPEVPQELSFATLKVDLQAAGTGGLAEGRPEGGRPGNALISVAESADPNHGLIPFVCIFRVKSCNMFDMQTLKRMSAIGSPGRLPLVV